MLCYIIYWPSLENGSDQLVFALYKLSIYPSVHKQLIQILFEAHVVQCTCVDSVPVEKLDFKPLGVGKSVSSKRKTPPPTTMNKTSKKQRNRQK